MRQVAMTVVMIASALWPYPSVQAQPSGLAVTFQSPGEVVQYEPVIVDLRVFNGLMEEVAFDLGIDRKSSIHMEVRRPDGTVSALPRLSPGGLTRVGRVSLPPRSAHLEQYVLNEWTEFTDEGTYRVQITLDSIFRTAGGAVLRPTTRHAFEISVAPLDINRLREVCERFAARASAEPTSRAGAEEQLNAARALHYVDHPVAVECLRRVAGATTDLDSIIVSALARIGTLEARNVLLEMLSGSNRFRFSLVNDAIQRFQFREWP